MSFKKIRHFIMVAETGSVSKAAIRLHIVQPALSQSIQRLEAELGTELFIRSKKGLSLTDNGVMFLNHAHGIINRYDKAKESLSEHKNSYIGSVSIAMTASMANAIAIPLYDHLSSEFPEVDVNIEEGLAGNIVEGLYSGWYDLVISYLDTPISSFSLNPLIEEELYLVGSYPLNNTSKKIQFSDLIDLPLIIPKTLHGVMGEVELTSKRMGFELNRLKIQAALHPTLQLVKHGRGYSLLPWSAFFHEIDAQTLWARRVVKPNILQRSYIIRQQDCPITPAMAAVTQALQHAINEAYQNNIIKGKILSKTVEANPTHKCSRLNK